MRVTNLGAVPLILDTVEWKGMFGLVRDPQLMTEQSQMAICDPDTKEVTPKGMTSPVNLIKATVGSVYPEKEDFSIPPINTKWNTPNEAADMLPLQVTWNWL